MISGKNISLFIFMISALYSCEWEVIEEVEPFVPQNKTILESKISPSISGQNITINSSIWNEVNFHKVILENISTQSFMKMVH